MACLHPICIRSPGSRGRGLPQFVLVPCGKCPECLKRRQQDWSLRIQQETADCLRKGGVAYFVLVTYDDDHLVYTDSDLPSLWPPDVQSFLKRLRRRLSYHLDITYRFFLCGEYGDSLDRPHYHICLFLDKFIEADDLRPHLEKCWNNGFIMGIKPMNVYYSEYVAKYSTKRFGIDYSGVIPPFARMSLKPAIGFCFVDPDSDFGKSNISFYRQNLLFHTFDESHTPFALPRYYRDRIHSIDAVTKRFFQITDDQLDSHFRNLSFNPNFQAELFAASDSYEDNFFRKLKYKSMNIIVL